MQGICLWSQDTTSRFPHLDNSTPHASPLQSIPHTGNIRGFNLSTDASNTALQHGIPSTHQLGSLQGWDGDLLCIQDFSCPLFNDFSEITATHQKNYCKHCNTSKQLLLPVKWTKAAAATTTMHKRPSSTRTSRVQRSSFGTHPASGNVLLLLRPRDLKMIVFLRVLNATQDGHCR
jgi:hypothetical protein